METSTTYDGAGAEPGLAAELRESLLLLGVSVAVTAVVTVGAQAALFFLG
jgi:hypothetical protein